jgi:hypothetical protein
MKWLQKLPIGAVDAVSRSPMPHSLNNIFYIKTVNTSSLLFICFTFFFFVSFLFRLAAYCIHLILLFACFSIGTLIRTISKRAISRLNSLERRKRSRPIIRFILIFLLTRSFIFNQLLASSGSLYAFAAVTTSSSTTTSSSQPSSYRLVGSLTSYAQYMPWYPCLNGSLAFEFKTHEPNGLLLYAQSLPYKYIQLSLADGIVRMRFRIGEKDEPRGIFLVSHTNKLNDEKWHELQITRINERTILSIDGVEKLYHVHKEANLEGYDLYFGDLNQINQNHLMENGNMLVIGGLPNNLHTYELSLGTALFDHRFNGYIRNVRALNCTSPHLQRLSVIASSNLRFLSDFDACTPNPCLNGGACYITGESTNTYRCDCVYTNYDGKNCEKCIINEAFLFPKNK